MIYDSLIFIFPFEEVTVDAEEDDDMIKQESAHGGGEVEVLPRSREEPQPEENEGGEGEGEFDEEEEGEVGKSEVGEGGPQFEEGESPPKESETQTEAGEPQPEEGEDEDGGDKGGGGEDESELVEDGGGGEGEIEDKKPTWRSGVGLAIPQTEEQDTSFRKVGSVDHSLPKLKNSRFIVTVHGAPTRPGEKIARYVPFLARSSRLTLDPNYNLTFPQKTKAAAISKESNDEVRDWRE